MISLLLVLLILLIAAAFLAASEMAFISVNPVRLRDQAGQGVKPAQTILNLRNENQNFLGALLIATNLTQVASTAVMSHIMQTYFSVESELFVTAVMTILLLVFCEIFPKEYGRLRSFSFLTYCHGLLSLVYRIFFWPAKFCIRMTSAVAPHLGDQEEKIFINEVEFKALVAESQAQGVLDPHERDFTNMILDFERIPVRSVMVPLAQVAAVELNSDISEVRRQAREKGDRVVLVYEYEPSIVAGVIYVFDVLDKQRENGPLSEFLKAPLFIPETMSLEAAFRILQRKRQSFALVTDSRYEVIGVVPIESLLLGKQ